MTEQPSITQPGTTSSGATTKLSIVIPCYNGAQYLAAAIDSAMEQDYPDKEIIVVNDGSTDDSLAVASAYGDAIVLVDQHNQGLSAARNAGIRSATGDLFAFLDCDDYWAPDFASKLCRALLDNDATIAYCGWQNVGVSGPRNEPFVPADYAGMPDRIEKLITGVRWPVHAAIVRRDALFAAGLFDTGLRCCEDFALWIRAAPTAPLVRVPEVLAFYRFHEGQMTRNRALVALSHFQVQMDFLSGHPEIGAHFDKQTLRRITVDELVRRGFAAYWSGDLPATRAIFRTALRHGYRSPGKMKYMLPALLPQAIHEMLVRVLRNGGKAD